jgi:nitrogen regulatory protein P-II 1
MKKIEAFIKSHRLSELILVLQELEGLKGLSVTTLRGFGRGCPEGNRILREKTKVEVFCADEMTEKIVSAIEKSAHTGLRSDGKIFVIPVEEAVRISNGQRGPDAI